MAKGKNYLGDIIYRNRISRDLTQDEFGSRYNISGPAVFKFEKGYVRPSLELWLSMSRDAEISQRRAVLLWLKSKLPAAYQEYVELQSAAVAEGAPGLASPTFRRGAATATAAKAGAAAPSLDPGSAPPPLVAHRRVDVAARRRGAPGAEAGDARGRQGRVAGPRVGGAAAAGLRRRVRCRRA